MNCPHCGAKNDAQTDLTGAEEPYPGAAGLCFTCCEWGIFDREGEELVIRMPTVREASMLALDRDAQRAQTELKKFKRRRMN